jgi:hypothetical protein
MVLPLIEELLTGDSKEIRDIAKNEAILVGFLTLAKGIDDLQDISMRFYEDSRSLYQATSSGRGIDELAGMLSAFFGKPVKPPGKSLPVALRFDPAVKYLGGLRKDQAFFLKKINMGSYYGALWPWQRDADKIEIHLGFCSPSMNDADYNKLGILVKKFLSKKKIEAVADIGGQIHGISLPSFLQMSEMEGATYTLKVASGDRVGYLYLDGGSLIAAQYEGQNGSEAAYRIISWDNAAIQIEPADADRVREIHEPLMHVMMESLKIKDEAGAASAPPPSGGAPVPPPPPQSEKVPLPADQPEKKKKKSPPQKAAPQKAPPPVANAPAATQELEPMLLTDLSPIKPFEKAVDNSVGKQNQMHRTSKLLIVLGILVLLAAAVVGGGKLLKQRQVSHRYEQLMADLAAEKAMDAQIVLLMQYLKAHPEDVHRTELEARLKDTNVEIETRDYKKTMADVKRLPIDAQYEKKALTLYTVFLSKYPQSDYAKPINAAIDGIREKMGTAYYQGLKKIPSNDFMARYTAYQEYLDQFPKGAEQKAVHRMIAELADQYYQTLEKQATACDTKQDWDDCLARCDHFLSDFARLPTVAKVTALRSALQDKKDLVDLTVKAELAGDDYVYAKQIFTDYLANRPDTTQKTSILNRIAALNIELAKKATWEKTEAYATNPAKDVFNRIQHVEKYIQNNASGPYAEKARNLIKQLEPELKAAIRAQQKEAQQRQALARQQAARARRNQESQRIQKIREQVSKQFRDVASRFTDNGDGTVTDRVTGLTWCMLDSYLELGRCISYRAAKTYIQQLNVGNHADWRLPTAGELAGIYKSSPFFPGSGADWYWTSEAFARGYHRVVDVVTSAPETVFSRTSQNEESCGNVRAVR